MKTRDVIDQYYTAVNGGDWQAWLALFDQHIVMDEQLAGHLEGIGFLRGAVDAMNRGYAKFLMHPLATVVQGDECCVIWHCEAETADGSPIDARGANFFRVKHGKIVYMSNFHDSVPFAPFTRLMAAAS